MAWTSPRTWVAGEVVSAAIMNAHVRDNFEALRGMHALVAASETTTSDTFTDLTTSGPAVTLDTGTEVKVTLTAYLTHNTAGGYAIMGVAVSGATTRAADDQHTLWKKFGDNTEELMASSTFYLTGLTAGSNTFTAKYREFGGTGTFANREIFVRGV